VIVKRCLDLHGGKIKVESKFGEGTVVTVRLPISKSTMHFFGGTGCAATIFLVTTPRSWARG
jgi:hypothetical protein